jgi:beta-glucanase (GH16 family)
MISPRLTLPLAMVAAVLTSCSPVDEASRPLSTLFFADESTELPLPLHQDSVVWAVNVGGGAYRGTDGVNYVSEQSVFGGAVGRVEKALGTQDRELYKSYRHGEITVQHPLPNGVYDLTFKFTEPEDIPVGARVFDVIAEEQVVIADLDIRQMRDNNHVSGLANAVTDVYVNDGQLDVSFSAHTGKPVLSALVVRRKPRHDPRWELHWSDEFDNSGAPDPDKWSADVWPPRKVNSEDQSYTDRSKNVRVENGLLILEAHREDFDGAKYTSGRIHSQGKGDFLYGRADVRARLPAGQGTWSAIWMLPSDPYRYSTTCKPNEDWQGSRTCDAWPNSGEIDILEHVGFKMHKVWGTVHNRAYFFINQEQRKASVEGRDVDTAFHVYSVEWNPDSIQLFFDGSLYFTYVNEGSDWRAWPYDHPYHLILNLAIGGDWGRAGGPIDDSIFPVRMEVDYVRVFKQEE